MKGNKGTTKNLAFTRLSPFEAEMLEVIMKVEGLTKSAAIRYIIRLAARCYGLLPAIDCPDCHSRQVEKTADDLLVCSKCGQEFGNGEAKARN